MSARWKEATEPESVVEAAEPELIGVPEKPAPEKPKRGRKAAPKEEPVVLCPYCSEAAGHDVPLTPDPKGIHACQCRLPNPPEE